MNLTAFNWMIDKKGKIKTNYFFLVSGKKWSKSVLIPKKIVHKVPFDQECWDNGDITICVTIASFLISFSRVWFLQLFESNTVFFFSLIHNDVQKALIYFNKNIFVYIYFESDSVFKFWDFRSHFQIVQYSMKFKMPK